MELGRSAWIRRERLERIANAERDRRAGRTALAIAALGEASEWPARAVLALALLPEREGSHARRILEEGLDVWALESGLPALDSLENGDSLTSAGELGDEVELRGTSGADQADPVPTPAFETFPLELDRPIEAGELERAFAEAEAQVDEMHDRGQDVNRVAERVLFDAEFEMADLAGEELDPLEESARLATSRESRGRESEVSAQRGMDAAAVPPRTSTRSYPVKSVEAIDGRASREIVLATLERWLQNLEHSRAGRIQ